MSTVFMTIGILGMVATAVGLIINLIASQYKAPEWQRRAHGLQPTPLHTLGSHDGWVWVTAQAYGNQPGILHEEVSWRRTSVVAEGTNRRTLNKEEVPNFLTAIDGDAVAKIRVRTIDRASFRRELRQGNPLDGSVNDGVPQVDQPTVEVNEYAILPGDHVSIIGKVSHEHGDVIIRAHYDDAAVWRGSQVSLTTAIENNIHWSSIWAPRFVIYGGFVAIVGLLLYSTI